MLRRAIAPNCRPTKSISQALRRGTFLSSREHSWSSNLQNTSESMRITKMWRKKILFKTTLDYFCNISSTRKSSISTKSKEIRAKWHYCCRRSCKSTLGTFQRPILCRDSSSSLSSNSSLRSTNLRGEWEHRRTWLKRNWKLWLIAIMAKSS